MERRNLGTGNESIDYVVMQTQQQKRGGIRANPFKGLPPIWVNYLQIPDDAELDRILAKVESLGGEILVPAASLPSGGTVAMIAGPSGAGIALQTWKNEEQLAKFGEQ